MIWIGLDFNIYNFILNPSLLLIAYVLVVCIIVMYMLILYICTGIRIYIVSKDCDCAHAQTAKKGACT